MNDVLKDFIKSNRDGFKDIPPASLWTKIDNNLKQKSNFLKPKKTATMLKYGLGASVVIAGTFLVINSQKEKINSSQIDNQVVIDSVPASLETIETGSATSSVAHSKKENPVNVFNDPAKAGLIQKTDTLKKKTVNTTMKSSYKTQQKVRRDSMSIADWFSAGSEKSNYEMFIDKGTRDAKHAATIKSIVKKNNGFGTLMQSILAGKYLGKRIRMTGYVKTQDVNEWASLWMWVSIVGGDETLGFDNMHYGKKDRSIKGTTPRTKYEIVLDVPFNSADIIYGAMLVGTGQIWFDTIEFEVVDNSIPTTGVGPIHFISYEKDYKSYHPTNFWRWYVPKRMYSEDGTPYFILSE